MPRRLDICLRGGVYRGGTRWAALCLGLLVGQGSADAQLLLNEILFNPPDNDLPNEYVEVRGAPNSVISNGVYLIALEGNGTGNPGKIQNVFDLSGRRIGGNGFLVFLQQSNYYAANAAATVLSNAASGDGFGSGASSSIGHRGDNGQTAIENASVTYALVRAPEALPPGDDMDSNNDGYLDGPATNWLMLDSVGVLGNNGAGDIAYGAINFRRNAAALTRGTVVPVSFTPGYVGRRGNTTGSAAVDWVASDNLGGASPDWTLGLSAVTVPAGFAGRNLNHIGGPNFGAPVIPGVVVTESGGGTTVTEAGDTDSFTITLTTVPAGPVTITVTAGPQLEISTDAGSTFGELRSIGFTSVSPVTILARAIDDNLVDTSPHYRRITIVITGTDDVEHYPLTTPIPPVEVAIPENDWVLLNELNVNPPGSPDAPWEFIELRGPPSTRLTNVCLLGVTGDADDDPGTVEFVADLSGAQLGANGLLALVGSLQRHSMPAETTVLTNATLARNDGGLNNGSVSFLLVSTHDLVQQGDDLDNGDNGKLERLPEGTSILDAVAWTDGKPDSVAYGGVVLSAKVPIPDAACRFAGNDTPRSPAAWFFGSLIGTDPSSLLFDAGVVSANFPLGAMLSPGTPNEPKASLSGLMPICGAIGDPSNPAIEFTAVNPLAPGSPVSVAVASSNPEVIPDVNLALTPLGGGRYRLALNPVGVGYSIITVGVNTGLGPSETAFHYASSARARPNSRYHLNGSDASTAFTIDPDWMLVGDDEKQIIRLFNRNLSGLPVKWFDPTPFLGLLDTEDGTPREVDLEGSTHVGNRIYWIGSHSHAGNATTRINRSRVFATDLGGGGSTNIDLTYVGRYDHLKTDLLAWDESNGHGLGAGWYGLATSAAEGVDPKAPDGSGFNIEGLTMAPGSTTVAWLGFRAPLVPVTNRTKALLLPVLNFSTLTIGGGPPGLAVFGPPIELNLGGRAIRSIEANAHGVLIVAGPPGGADEIPPRDFRLYTWTGNPADAPEERAADLSGLSPEALVELPPQPWTPASIVQLISDNGVTDFYGDGVFAKHLPVLNFKKSRSDRVALGDIVIPRPVIREFARTGHGLLIDWYAQAGRTYRVQSRSDWDVPWVDATGDVMATDATASALMSPPPGGSGFYRVIVAP